MIEPSWTNRYITFSREPSITVRMSYVQLVNIWIARIYLCCSQERPVGSACFAIFISYPSTPRSSIRETDGIRLQFFNRCPCTREVIIVSTINATMLNGSTIVAITTISAIKPYLEDIAIASQQVFQLRMIILYIRSRTIVGTVSVPRRKIDTKLQTILSASRSQFTHHIAIV